MSGENLPGNIGEQDLTKLKSEYADLDQELDQTEKQFDRVETREFGPDTTESLSRRAHALLDEQPELITPLEIDPKDSDKFAELRLRPSDFGTSTIEARLSSLPYSSPEGDTKSDLLTYIIESDKTMVQQTAYSLDGGSTKNEYNLHEATPAERAALAKAFAMTERKTRQS